MDSNQLVIDSKDHNYKTCSVHTTCCTMMFYWLNSISIWLLCTWRQLLSVTIKYLNNCLFMSLLQFQATYGKPLLAARDPKCSAKDAEAGALAMEALHKQVAFYFLFIVCNNLYPLIIISQLNRSCPSFSAVQKMKSCRICQRKLFRTDSVI